MIPVDNLVDGNIIQAYIQLLNGQNTETVSDQWDVGTCTSYYTSLATIGETTYEAYDSYLDFRGAQVFNSGRGYLDMLANSIVADPEQDWNMASYGSTVLCDVTNCYFTCQMKRKLSTEESDKDLQLAIGNEATVFGGFRIYESGTAETFSA